MNAYLRELYRLATFWHFNPFLAFLRNNRRNMDGWDNDTRPFCLANARTWEWASERFGIVNQWATFWDRKVKRSRKEADRLERCRFCPMVAHLKWTKFPAVMACADRYADVWKDYSGEGEETFKIPR